MSCLRKTFRVPISGSIPWRSEEHTSELQSRSDLVCRLLLEKKKQEQVDPLQEPNPLGPDPYGVNRIDHPDLVMQVCVRHRDVHFQQFAAVNGYRNVAPSHAL